MGAKIGVQFKDAEDFFNSLMLNLQNQELLRQSFDAIEETLRCDVRELGRKLLQGHIDSRGKGDIGPKVVTNDKIALSHKRVLSRKMHTVFGAVTISRVGYSSRNHANLFPLDAIMNLPPNSYSYGLQRLLIQEAVKNSFGEAIEVVNQFCGVKCAKRQAIEMIRNGAADFDDYYQQMIQSVIDKDCNKEPIMVLTTDGKGIIMRASGLRECTARKLNNSKKLKTRLSRGEKQNRKRMAQVASIYAIDRFVRSPRDIIEELRRINAKSKRPKPVAKRVWASVEKDAVVVIEELFCEAKRRDPEQNKEWVVLVDGQELQMKALRAAAKRYAVLVNVVLDIIHVIEYLWKAARLFFEETSQECEAWVWAKLELILNENGLKVAGSIRMLAVKRHLSKVNAEVAEKCAVYIQKNESYMNYKTYLRRGYPISTGVIEGACRYLIKDRMDITGARWGLDGAECILRLRSIMKSGDFESYWNFHLRQEFNRNHAGRYDNISSFLRIPS